MGDRQEYIISMSNGNYISIYEHWQTPLPLSRVANILNEISDAGRLHDESYATRILISRLIQNHDSTLGTGILVNERQESEHRIPVIVWSTQPKVQIRDNVSDRTIVQFEMDEFINKYATNKLVDA